MFKILSTILAIAALLIPSASFAKKEVALSEPRQVQITAQEAETAALNHAELTPEAVTGLHSHYDSDDRIDHWDVEFMHEDYEYDYEIDPDTGEILTWSREYEGRQTSKETQPAPSAALLTAEEARDIALKHAGLTLEDVTRLKVKLDHDDGVPEYEIEFFQGRMEYEYDIHGETGKILSWDKEYDD